MAWRRYGDNCRIYLGEEHGGNTRYRIGVRHPHAPGHTNLLFPGDVDEKLVHKRVGFAFLAYSRSRSVSRQDSHLISKREQLRFNSLEQLLAIASGKVPTTDAPAKRTSPPIKSFFAREKKQRLPGQ